MQQRATIAKGSGCINEEGEKDAAYLSFSYDLYFESTTEQISNSSYWKSRQYMKRTTREEGGNTPTVLREAG